MAVWGPARPGPVPSPTRMGSPRSPVSGMPAQRGGVWVASASPACSETSTHTQLDSGHGPGVSATTVSVVFSGVKIMKCFEGCPPATRRSPRRRWASAISHVWTPDVTEGLK